MLNFVGIAQGKMESLNRSCGGHSGDLTQDIDTLNYI